MDVESLKKDVIAFSHSIGIDLIGFTTAEPFEELKNRLVVHREQGFESGFEEKDIEKRCDPKLALADARSIISIALAYPAQMENSPKSEPGKYRGIMARVAWGEDYHRVLHKKLEKLRDFIQGSVPGAQCINMVDTGVLSDRAVAERAGLGWIGKNTSLITPEFGSWVYLGEMVTNIPFPPDSPLADDCGDCQRCLDFCPTGALVQGGQLNSKRCLAYLTQVKEDIPEEFKMAMGNRLYGCDTCQQACPKNKGKHVARHSEFTPDGELAKPLLKNFLKMGKREFAEKYGQSSSAWRGKKPIQRNAILGLAHFKDQSSIPDLQDILLKDSRPSLRSAAAWSLGQIGGDQAEEVLRKLVRVEKDERVLEEIKKSLRLLESVED